MDQMQELLQSVADTQARQADIQAGDTVIQVFAEGAGEYRLP